MRIQTTAPDRKTLAKALAEYLEDEAVYSGPPSFAYTIGQVTVDRDGLLNLQDDMDPVPIQGFLVSKGWLEPEHARLSISVPASDLTVKAMHNLILLLYSKQYLLGKALKSETIHIDAAVIERLNVSLPENLADFKALLDDFKAQGLIVGLDFTDKCISLSYPLSEAQDVAAAYTQLTASVIAAAKAASRVTPECQQPDNEKYYMRSWLVRLGFGGKESKGLRDVLLKHLKGHSAFRSDVEAQRHRDKYAEIRKIKREINAVEARHDET